MNPSATLVNVRAADAVALKALRAAALEAPRDVLADRVIGAVVYSSSTFIDVVTGLAVTAKSGVAGALEAAFDVGAGGVLCAVMAAISAFVDVRTPCVSLAVTHSTVGGDGRGEGIRRVAPSGGEQ